MKTFFQLTIALSLCISSGLHGLELIDESSIDRLKSMPYEEYDSGYGLWDSADLELFVSEDGNFSIGLWKSKPVLKRSIHPILIMSSFYLSLEKSRQRQLQGSLINSYQAKVS